MYPQPLGLPFAHVIQPPPPQQPRPSPFPYIPIDILRRIMHIGDLRNKDILAIAAACKPLRRCAHMAYNSLHFQLDMTTGTARGMFQLQRSLTLLMRALEEGRGHPTHIFHITFFAARLSGPSVDASSSMERDESRFALEGYSEEYLVTLALSDIDYQLSQLVSPDMTPNLDTFILDASATGQLLPFPTTLEVLARDRQRRFEELGLVRVCTGWGINVPPALTDNRRNFDVTAHNLQVGRITIRSEDAQLSRAFLCQPVGVHALDFRESVQSSEPWVAVFGGDLRTAASACTVKRLCLTCGGSNPQYRDHSEFVIYSLTTGWNDLTTLSISAFFKLEHLAMLAQCPLRRLRLTVNVDDQFMPEFGPYLMSGVLNHFPDLEELVLDNMRATLCSYALTEECLIEWSNAIRIARSLRIVALSTHFVLEPSECGSDYADAGTVCSDIEMSDSIESSLNMSDMQSGKQVDLESPEDFLDDLAMFSEDFFDKHLRSERLHELRFLYDDPQTGYTESVGFRPQAASPSAADGSDKRDYTAIPSMTTYDMFWEPGWRRRPDDYLRTLLYTDKDARNDG
ncbi:hypothetical protein DAEQUDRAFT_47765 [Daedalea quercina L-15889]|uniref:F-box domain-containing protein n=1 Tax=Daedalea quercina L-15889 TaxID=1314783 RepID=A0A165LBE0_9APHY|nr:hypothetical protein DAEQUDRAFT_47765 [Daedalea quercina L-15889]